MISPPVEIRSDLPVRDFSHLRMQSFISVPDTAVTVARVGGGGGGHVLRSGGSSGLLGGTETSQLVDDVEDRISDGWELDLVTTIALPADPGEVEEEGLGPHLSLGLVGDRLHHEHVAGAVGVTPGLLPELGGDETEEPPVVIVDSAEPEVQSLITIGSSLDHVRESLGGRWIFN